MRTIIIALFVFSAFTASAQSKTMCLAPMCNPTINVGDSALVFAQLTASDGFGSIRFLQTAGPTVAIPSLKLANAGPTAAAGTQGGFVAHPAAAGTYVFSVTGTSLTGTVATTTDTLFVNTVPKRIAYVTVTYTDSSRVKTQ